MPLFKYINGELVNIHHIKTLKNVDNKPVYVMVDGTEIVSKFGCYHMVEAFDTGARTTWVGCSHKDCFDYNPRYWDTP